MNGRTSLLVSAALLSALLAAFDCSAAWIENGVLVCGEIGRQFRQQMVTDGHGGAVIAWSDQRTGTTDLYAQRIDGFGLALWQAGGSPICTATSWQEYLKMVPDASGGAIAVWIDNRAGGQRLYAQRIDGSGIARWTPDGILLSAYFVQTIAPAIAPDGSGGAIVAWGDNRNGNYDVFAQRIDADGTLLWTSEGIPVAVAATDQFGPSLLADGSGGAMVVWMDNRTGLTTSRAQRVSANGSLQWNPDGVPCGGLASPCAMAADGSGGAFVAGLTYIPGENLGAWDNSLSVLRIGSDGALLWPDVVTIADSTWEWPTPGLVSDGDGGAIIVWDGEVSGGIDIWGQRLDSLGTKLWGDSGVDICSRAGDQAMPRLDSDGAHGAVVSYQDHSVYAQRIDPDGNTRWSPNGVVLCSGTVGAWPLYATVVSDGTGGAIAAWYDTRGGQQDLYAARVDAAGNAPVTEAAVTPSPARRLRQNFPNPFNPSTTITIDLEKASHAKLSVYDSAGRLIALLLDQRLDAGRRDVTWNGEDRSGRRVASGVYYCRLTAGGCSESIAIVLTR